MDWREARLGGQVLPGWEPIVDRLHQHVLELDPDIEVQQVKEKFGSLRYYFLTKADNDILEQLEVLVQAAEAEARRTCEVCGQSGRLRQDRSWAKTLCDDHANDERPAWQIAEELKA